MKRTLSIILALMLCLSLCACGGSKNDNTDNNTETTTNAPEATMSKDDMLSIAKTVNADNILNDIGGNKAKAKTYIDSVYCITGHVLEIEENYAIVLAADTGDWNDVIHSDDWYGYAEEAVFRVYFSTEELIKLNKCENIQFVGKITNITTFEYHSIEPLSLEVTDAFLVQTDVEYLGHYRLG